MNRARWQEIDRLFHALLTRPVAERAIELDRGCAADPALRAEVESLLAAHDSASSGFIDLCPFESQQTERLEPTFPLAPGRRIGRYTLCGVLGRGGAGVVYEARQDEPARTVALKVVRALPYADDLTPRLFRREGQALARLEHPGIAAIYEAGSDADCYYFAMERVEGLPITAFALSQKLSTRQRLELFRRVCEAVHYAHQRGVIHRDLKPANILVTAAGQPKVLDFGLARIIDTDIEHTQITDPGVFHGTLAYASPEHLAESAAHPGRVDARSDVYSLGVVLHELLTGRRPYDIAGLSLPDAARVIRDEPIRRVSATAPHLRGEIATIVHKMLEKQPEQRYTSAAAIGEDIERYLTGQAIQAHPPSTLYQLRKLVGRHKLVAGAAAAIIVLISAFAVAMALLYRQSQLHLSAAEKARGEANTARQQARDEAERANLHAADAVRQARTSERVRDFMTDVFISLKPATTKNQTVSVADVLTQARKRLLSGLETEPLVKATLLYQLAMVHSSWGQGTKARPMYEEAVSLQRAHLPRGHADTIKTLDAIAWTCFNLGQAKEGEPYIDEALRELEVQDSPDPSVFGHALVTKGRILRARRAHAEALGYFERALPILRSAAGEESIDVTFVYHCIGNVKRESGLLDEAQPILEDVVRRATRLSSPDSTDVSEAMRDLGALQRQRGCLQESEDTLREAWGRMERYLGPASPRALGVLRQLILTLEAAGKLEQAADLLRETITAIDEPPIHLRVELANVLMLADRFDEAEPVLRECLELPAEDEAAASQQRNARAALKLCLARQRPAGP